MDKTIEIAGSNKQRSRNRMTTKQLTRVAILSVIAYILMFLEFGLPIFPGFLMLDFSDLPALIGAFAMGPMAGVMIQFVKATLHFITKSWSGGVGELANFIIGVFLCGAGGAYLSLSKRPQTCYYWRSRWYGYHGGAGER